MKALPQLLKFCLLPILASSLHAATYKVKPGDTLSSIARKNGTTASQLMKENGISNPNLLKIGQTLKISGKAKSSSPKKKATPAAATTSRTSGNYTVKSGETLYSIARKHGLSVSQLSNLNPGLNPSKISVGQKLTTTGVAKKGPPKPKAKPTPKPMPVIADNKPKTKVETAPKPAPKPKAEPKPKSNPQPTPQPKAQPGRALVDNKTPAPKTKPSLTIEKKLDAPSTISSITVKKEISFGKLANQHRTSTKQLNALNGWTLKPTTILAQGSEIYVPGT